VSFIEGFFDGVASTVRTVFGIDDEQPKKAAATSTPARSKDLAIDSATTYERPSTKARRASSSTDSGASSTPLGSSAFILANHLGSASSAPPAKRPATLKPAAAPAPTMPPHVTASREEAPPAAAAVAELAPQRAVSTAARARVIDAGSSTELGTIESLGGVGAAGAAATNVQSGIDYFAATFGRDGVDGAGSGVDVLINDRSTDSTGKERFVGNGGYFAMPDGAGGVREAIHFGTGTSYQAARGLVEQHEMLYADDLAIHELVHGVIRKETGHLGGEADEAGSTNEGIADVMAAAATRDWSIGEGMYSERSDYRRMRNIAQPGDPTAIHGLYTSMAEVADLHSRGEEVEEHWGSGIISTAAYRVQQRIGGEAGWQAVEHVFYDSIDNNRLGDMSFASVAGALRTSAASVYGDGSSVAQVFDEELRRAGL
jgi:hypothetical protein